MSAVAEMPSDLQEQINAFKMPRPRLGENVLWWRHGTTTVGDPEVAFILKIGQRNVKLRTADGMIYQTVLHVDDPKLKLNEHQREPGAWQFAEADSKLHARVVALEAKVAELSELVEMLASKKK
jgi:hypothetical protein